MGLVLDPIVQAIRRPEFEDGLGTGVSHGGYQCHSGDFKLTLCRVRFGPRGVVVFILTPVGPNSNTAEFHTSVILIT